MVARSSACTESMRASSSSSDTVTPKPSNAPHGVGIEHQNVLERRAAVDYGVETVEALAIVGDGQFHIRIVEDTLGLRRGISVVDRHVHRADGGQCEVEHAPLVAGGGEDGDGIALVDAECDEAFCGGEPRHCGIRR